MSAGTLRSDTHGSVVTVNAGRDPRGAEEDALGLKD